MLILRVASGRAWSTSTVARTDTDTVRFNTVAGTTTADILSTDVLDDQTKSITTSPDKESGSVV